MEKWNSWTKLLIATTGLLAMPELCILFREDTSKFNMLWLLIEVVRNIAYDAFKREIRHLQQTKAFHSTIWVHNDASGIELVLNASTPNL